MRVYIKSMRNNIDAVGEYNIKTKELIVLKNSLISENIAYSETFRGANSVEKQRQDKVKGNILLEDVKFKSSSTAANFVTGRSTNGLVTWKNKNGKTIKEIINEG